MAMPQKSNDQWAADSPVPQEKDDELEMADDDEDFDDGEEFEENEDEDKGVEEA
jgi:hypothetical protein